MPKKHKTPSVTNVMTELEEVVQPVRRTSGYAELLAKVERYPNRWFVVSRHTLQEGYSKYEYAKPYLVASYLKRQYSKNGFMFMTHRESANVRAVLVRYDKGADQPRATKKRVAAIKQAKQETRKAGPQ